MNNTENIFTKLGGTFCRPFVEFQERLSKIKAYVFDWDGVFNDGIKTAKGGSPFSEVDAMGTNMLRLGHWLKYGELPCVGVITGEDNPTAHYLSQREKFHALYFNATNKLIAFDHFLKSNNLKAEQVAFIYDDVLDLGVAGTCGLRLLVKHAASPLFQHYAINNNRVEYITAHDGHGVREACELILSAFEKYDEAIGHRSVFDAIYQRYLNERQQIKSKIYFIKEGEAVEAA